MEKFEITNIKNKWQIRIVTLTLFLLGFITGVLAIHTYNLWIGGAAAPTKQERYQEAFDQLNLTESQKIEVQNSVAEIRENIQKLRQDSEPRMQEIRARNDARLQKILTPEQWSKFQELREEIRKLDK